MVQPDQSNTAFPRQPIYDECPLALPYDTKAPNFQIRLIELAPGDYRETISCKFFIASLGKPLQQEYTALSYATEDTTVCQPIRLNGKLFSTPPTLVLALKRMRKRDEPVIL
jgi:hypothetical protein